MKTYKFLFICLISPWLTSAALHADSLLFSHTENPHVVVHNRVLARVNDKPITVLDLMKKMDMLFLKQFPEYTSSPAARCQYYQVNWPHVMRELIDKELILADAQESKLPISSGDVRQEMEILFGPNIIANLDKIGLSFDEAFKIVQGDLLIRRMMSYRVNNKALRSVTPQILREAYEEFAKTNIKQETWHYQVVTIRNNEATLGAETAQQAFQLLTEEKIDLADLDKILKEKGAFATSSLSVSEPFYHTEKDLSDVIKHILIDMTPESYSHPAAQKSRTDKSTVFRIVYLIEKVPGGTIPYSEIENQLKDELYGAAMAKESEAYLKKLHDHYDIHVDDIEALLPADFQPFTLK